MRSDDGRGAWGVGGTSRRPRGTWLVGVVGLVIVATALVACFGLPSIAGIREVVVAAGWAAPLVFVVGYAALAMTPLPASLLTVAAGVLFGVPVGLAVVVVGAVAGALAAFTLSRRWGRTIVAGIDVDRVRRLDAMLAVHGFVAVVAVRLVPLLPFGALNYACGVTAVRARDFTWGTAVGILPGAAAYVTVGAYGAQPGSVPLLAALGGVGVLVVGGLVAGRRRDRRPGSARDSESGPGRGAPRSWHVVDRRVPGAEELP